MGKTVACFATNADEFDVRAAVVLHLDPDMLPKGWLEEAAAAARKHGQELEGLPEYVVACFGFAERDRYRLVMDMDRQHLIYERRSASSLEAAGRSAREWVGDHGQERRFRELPGIYQAAYHDWLTGRRWDVDMTTEIWAIPVSGNPNVFAAREFPPPLAGKPTEITPDPGEVSFIALPRPAVDKMYRARGW